MTDIITQAANILEIGAPTVASMFGGPLAGQAVAIIEKTLGLNPTGDKTLASTALLGATPDQILAIKAEGDSIAAKYLDAGIKIVQASDADRASARQMQIQTKSLMEPALALLVVLCAAAVAILFFTGRMTATLSNPAVAATGGSIIGYVFSELRLVTAFYFGSSAGSEGKNVLIEKALNSTPPNA